MRERERETKGDEKAFVVSSFVKKFSLKVSPMEGPGVGVGVRVGTLVPDRLCGPIPSPLATFQLYNFVQMI